MLDAYGNSPRQKLLERFQELKSERSEWDAHWRDLADYVRPWGARFELAETNRGRKRHDKIINSTAPRAARILRSGLMAGITSPARPWFKLGLPDPDLAENHRVRSWLHAVEERMRLQMSRSNLYNGFAALYDDLGVFGTSALFVDEDREQVFRAYPTPIGSYCLSAGARQRVDTFFEELPYTVAKVVERFGLAACSRRVRELYDRGEYREPVRVLHVVEPNRERDLGKVDRTGMTYRSCWLELDLGEGDPGSGYLREGGYREFPIIAPRWDLLGQDVYGNSAGMEALGDAKAVQTLERQKGKGVAKLSDPPLVAPSSLRNDRVSLIPGEVNYVDGVGADKLVRPVHEYPAQGITALEATIREHEERINAAFYADLFLMLAESDRREITAREVDERHEEKMLQLGPVLERLHDEMLNPVIDRVFAIMWRRGLLPPLPEELAGVDIKVEYISILAQAQKMLGLASIDRLYGFVGGVAAVDKTVLDKIDHDKALEAYASAAGVPPELIRPQEQVDAMRADRAAQERAMAAAEAAKSAASAAQTLSQTEVQGAPALDRLLGTLGPSASGVSPVVGAGVPGGLPQ